MKHNFTIRRCARDGAKAFPSVAQHGSFRRQKGDEFQLCSIEIARGPGGW
jgi:hypothetical protein